MAADRPENDYVHLVAAHLSEKRNHVEFQSVCFQDWETNEAGDRDSYLKDLDDVLSELDDARQTYLLTRIEDKQTFVTTCDSAAFARTNGKLVFVDHGTVREG